MTWYAEEPIGSAFFLPASWLKRVLTLHRSTHMQSVWLGPVEAGGTGREGNTLYWGEGESLGFLDSLHGGCRRPAPPLRWSRLARRVRAPDRDFVLYVEVNRLCSWLLPSGGYWTQPWIRQRVRLEEGGGRVGSRAVEDVYGRRVRRYGYAASLCRDFNSVVEFFSRMYLPYIENRYGEKARFRPLRELAGAQRSGFLLKVEEGGQWVAGAVCRMRRREVTVIALAVAPPFQDRLRRGALSAVYYFLVRWAREQGLESVDMLRSRPHLEDGVYEHKRRFGARPYADAWPHTAIGVYPPRSGSVPERARGLLVRRGSGFVPLAELLRETACLPCRGV